MPVDCDESSEQINRPSPSSAMLEPGSKVLFRFPVFLGVVMSPTACAMAVLLGGRLDFTCSCSAEGSAWREQIFEQGGIRSKGPRFADEIIVERCSLVLAIQFSGLSWF